VLLSLNVAAGSVTAPAQEASTLREQGEYVFRLANCGGCHTATSEDAVPLAGGRKLETSFGAFYSPNITPHIKHGIGLWGLSDLARALRHGVSPDGSDYYPVFPYPSYSGIRDEDLLALMAYLRRVPKSDRPNQPHDLPWYLSFRIENYFWKLLFLSPEPFEPRSDKSAEWNRGAYLVNVLGHCGECHTSRNRFGARIASRHLAGNPDGPEGKAVPNITPHEEDGIGAWSDYDIREYLKEGLTPEGDVAGGVMAEVIEDSLSFLTRADADAIVTYLRSVPALTSPD
jgi:mono/diheme cytochrome c family protein